MSPNACDCELLARYFVPEFQPALQPFDLFECFAQLTMVMAA